MRVLFGGDVVIRGRAEQAFREGKTDLLAAFSALASRHDLTVVNLEAPLTHSLSPIPKTGPAIKMSPEAMGWLKDAGVNLVTLANNHIFDYGESGLEDTLDTLSGANLSYVGAGMSQQQINTPFLLQRDGSTLAIVNFAENEWSTSHGESPGATPLSPVRNYHAISKARRVADLVAVVVHGGHEHYPLPSPRMKELYRFFVDAGADLVINHHQHCVSGFEVYKGKPIFYGIGNLFFDHDHHRNGDWTKGVLVSFDLLPGQDPDFEIIHFDQCANKPLFSLCAEEEAERRKLAMTDLSAVIANDEELEKSFLTFVDRKANQYQSYLEPVTNRYYLALMNRGLLPSLVSAKKKLLMQNVMRCESHRELLLQLLEK